MLPCHGVGGDRLGLGLGADQADAVAGSTQAGSEVGPGPAALGVGPRLPARSQDEVDGLRWGLGDRRLGVVLAVRLAGAQAGGGEEVGSHPAHGALHRLGRDAVVEAGGVGSRDRRPQARVRRGGVEDGVRRVAADEVAGDELRPQPGQVVADQIAEAAEVREEHGGGFKNRTQVRRSDA